MVLKYLDMYALKPFLLLEGKKTYSSSVGMLLTLITVGFSVFLLILSTQELFSRSKPQVIQSIFVDNDPDKLEFNSDNFVLAFGVNNRKSIYYKDDSVFTLKVFKETFTKTESSQYKVNKIELNTVSCAEMDTEIYKSAFHSVPTEHLTCLDPKERVEIRGIFGSDIYVNLEVQISKCDSSKNPNCKAESEINQILEGNHFSYFISDSYFAPKSSETPFVKYAVNNFTMIGSFLSKHLFLRTQKQHLSTDTGYFTDVEELTEDFAFENQSESSRTDSSSHLLSLFVYFSTRRNEISRRYIKVQRIAADILPMVKVMMVAFKLVVELFEENRYFAKILGEECFRKVDKDYVAKFRTSNSVNNSVSPVIRENIKSNVFDRMRIKNKKDGLLEKAKKRIDLVNISRLFSEVRLIRGVLLEECQDVAVESVLREGRQIPELELNPSKSKKARDEVKRQRDKISKRLSDILF